MRIKSNIFFIFLLIFGFFYGTALQATWLGQKDKYEVGEEGETLHTRHLNIYLISKKPDEINDKINNVKRVNLSTEISELVNEDFFILFITFKNIKNHKDIDLARDVISSIANLLDKDTTSINLVANLNKENLNETLSNAEREFADIIRGGQSRPITKNLDSSEEDSHETIRHKLMDGEEV